jgi:hypothetical protein
MTSLFRHPLYAEDQPYARTVLYLHVMRASAMSFSFLSLAQFPASIVATRYRNRPIDYNAILARTLKTSGRGLVLGTAAGAFMIWGRMRGRQEIEWKDRSWRILEISGEVKTDWVTLGGAGVGAVVGLVAARRGEVSVTVGNAVLGGSSVGVAGGVPYMIASFAIERKTA